MLTLLDTILKPGALVPAFQPIFSVDGQVRKLHSLECLMRGPKGTSVERADVMFKYVRLKCEEIAVDRACMRAALQGVALLPGEPRIAVNVHACTLGRDVGFVSFLKGLADDWRIGAERLTVEIIEHAPYWDVSGIWRAIAELRTHGMRVAVDDVGAGQSNYNMILDCRPDILKVDAYVVQGCHGDGHRMAVLESIATLAHKFGCQTVAEGVEDDADLQVVLELGIHLIQGYLLARPMSVRETVESGLLWKDQTSPPARSPGTGMGPSCETAGSQG
jgi:EAL domain-containing protein (putative c-di-GMP-specific phosphodiesterase class I)